MAPASGWPGKINLAKHRVMLDVAGGSGAHSIGAVDRWPKLSAIVFDTAPVCEVASEIVLNYRLQARIGTHIGDMWKDPFPSADIHFYSMIFHDWPADICRFLAKKSFDALGPGGRNLGIGFDLVAGGRRSPCPDRLRIGQARARGYVQRNQGRPGAA